MYGRLIITLLMTLLFPTLHPAVGATGQETGTPEGPDEAVRRRRALEIGKDLREELRVDRYQVYLDWEEGLRIETGQKHIRLKVGGRINLDAGNIGTDDDLPQPFPDPGGFETNLRRAAFTVLSTFYDTVDLKLEMDFSNVKDVKDNWVGIRRVPIIGYVQFGHQKEPFSLEELAGGNSFTFMERALPTEAFAPRRNLGFMTQSEAFDRRMTWAVGGFWGVGKTSSLDDLISPKDRIAGASGFNITGRVTGLPWQADGGRRYLHLGFSYSHQFRDEKDSSARVRYATPPESFLEENLRLVDTDAIFADGVDLINPEFALVSGPLSLQGEYFHAFVDSNPSGDPQFWGFYLYTSCFLTGEYRNYNTSRGTFSRLRPDQNFRLRDGQWGALEAGLRVSHIDLTDGHIKGGRESNLTFGLNWYLNREVRLMFNYIRAYVRGRRDPAVDDWQGNIFQARFQFAF